MNIKLSTHTEYHPEASVIFVPDVNGVRTEKKLTPLQNKLFYLLVDNKNELVIREKSDAIWTSLGSGVHGCRRSIDVFINQLRNIIDHDATMSIETLHGNGHKLVLTDYQGESEVNND